MLERNSFANRATGADRRFRWEKDQMIRQVTEKHEDEIYDANFGMPALVVWGDNRTWWDIPADRHDQGCNLAFGDGHAEHGKWRVPKVVNSRFATQYVPDEELPDYRRLQEGYRQKWD